MKKMFLAVLVMAMAIWIFNPVSAQLADSPWPMFHHNVRHTGQSPYNGPESPMLKWKFMTGGYIGFSSPVIGADGTVYIGSDDNYLYAINSNGALKWKFQTDNSIASSPAISIDGTTYIGSQDWYLYAINPNGTQKWKFQTEDYVDSSPAIGVDGTVYVGSKDKYLYAINPNGTLKWKFGTGKNIYSSPAIGVDGTVYVGSYDGYLYAINSDGALKWKFQTGNYIYSSPAIGVDGTVYVGSGDGYLYTLNPDGTLKWKFQTGNYIYSSPAIGVDGTVYVGSENDYFYAINPNGTQKWKFQTNGNIYSSPAIDVDGTVYVGSYDGYLYAINSDGALKWKFQTGNYIYSSPAIGSDGTIYVGSDDNYLYAIGEAGPTPTPTLTKTATATPTLTITATLTITPTITETPTLTPTLTITFTPTPNPSDTITSTPTPTPSPSDSSSKTPTKTPTPTPSPSGSKTPTKTPTLTPSPSSSSSVTKTKTQTPTPTLTKTLTKTPTKTSTQTPTKTPTPTPTPTGTIKPQVEFYDKEEPWRPVIGAAADGAAEVIVKVSNLPKNLTKYDVQVWIADGDGWMKNDATFGNGIFTQTYIAPKLYARDGHPEDVSNGYRDIWLSVKVNNLPLMTPKFILVKPPVVLLHGLGGNANGWDDFALFLTKNYGYQQIASRDSDYKPFVFAYQYENYVSFEKVSYVPKAPIDAIVRYTKSVNGIAVKKADIIAHSMGGVLSKLYGNKANINSITTIGTPHLGSPLADFVWKHKDSWAIVKLYSWLFGSPAQGAIQDLRVDGGKHCMANQVDVPICVIVGLVGPSEVNDSPLINQLTALLKLLKIIPFSYTAMDFLDKEVFRANRHDLVVSEESQEGGWSKAKDVYPTWHLAEKNNSVVRQNVVNFLNRTETTKFQYESYKTTNAKLPELKQTLYFPEIKMSSGSVKIVSPSQGASFKSGDALIVEVDVIGNNPQIYVALSTREYGIIENPPFSFQFTVNESILGPIEIMAVGVDDAGYIGMDEVTVNIESALNLVEMKVYPEIDPLNLKIGQQMPLMVYGIFEDGVEREITKAGCGTIYSVSDTNVIEISPNGLLSAKSIGNAVVTVENSGLREEIAIEVETPEPEMYIELTDYDFGWVEVDKQKTNTFSIENIGLADLQLGQLAISGDIADFVISNDNCSNSTIAASGKSTFDVVFAPTSTGLKNAVIAISESVSIQLSGNAHLATDYPIELGLKMDPEKASYEIGDYFWLTLNLRTAPEPNQVDVYLIIIAPDGRIYSALDWQGTIKPVLTNILMPGNISFSDAVLFKVDIASLESLAGSKGSYVFGLGTFEPGTGKLISNIATVNFVVK